MANDLDAPQAEIHWPDYTWSAVAGAVGRTHCYGTTYTCPQVMWATQVTVNLAIDDNTPFEYADDPPINDSITFKVYRDHLQRDYCNEGDLNKYIPGGPVCACHGAATHAYDGTDGPQTPPWNNWTRTRIFWADADPNIPPFTPLQTGGLSRRDVFVLTGYGWHCNTCKEGTSVWEANGQINPARWGNATLEAHLALRTSDNKRVVHEIWHYPYMGP